MRFQGQLDRYKRKKILKILRNTSPQKFEKLGQNKLPSIIRKAIKQSPAYHEIIKQFNPALLEANDLYIKYASLPILTKENYFSAYSLEKLAGKKHSDIKLAMTSSGYSGSFAYGFSSKKSAKDFRLGVDTSFDYCFDISNRKTFLINCEPMGVHVDTSMTIAETSVRSDMAIALLKKVSPFYDQTVLLGDPYFMKKLVEEGDNEKINWRKLNVSIVTGQDWLPESLRTYLANRLEIDLDNDSDRTILTTMGMTELGINVFHESKYLVKLRREVAKNPELKKLLVKSKMTAPPLFYHYYPFRTHIESLNTSGIPEMLFTSLDPKSIIPVIRYSTGDSGTTITYSKLKEKLGEKYKSLLPDLKLPLGIILGRSKNKFNINKHIFYLEDIKEGLFSNPEVASAITGLIKVETGDRTAKVLVHLKKGIKHSAALQNLTKTTLSDYLQFEIDAYLQDYEKFSGNLELSYEHKLYARD